MTTGAAQDVGDDPVDSLPRAARRRKRRTPSWGTVCLLLAPVVVLVVMAWRYRWVGDDGFINYRVVQQILAGHGPVFNRGERVEAGTSPLWILILAVADLLTPVRLEWLAVYLGIAGAASGVALATFGTYRLRPARADALTLPVGAFAFVAIPAVWTFATGGLEVGLSLAWIGGSWFCLARHGSEVRADARPDRRLLPVLLGLGPLVRPDLAIVSIGFFVALLCIDRAGGWVARVRAAAVALAIPVAFEIFRMGYYGLLVPNTALAKEASLSYFSQGWRYLDDFNRTYWLALPIALLVVLTVLAVGDAPGRLRSATGVLTITAVGVGVVLALYWIRVGGDWMHARVLLPALFCLLLPTMTVTMRGWRVLVSLGVLVWAVWCGVALRESAAGHDGIIDPRVQPVALAKGHQIVTIDDFRTIEHATIWNRLKQMAATDRSGILLFHPGRALEPLPLARRDHPPGGLVVRQLQIGMVAYATGPDVYIADALSLADPVGSHLRLVKRGRPGHEKLVPSAWVVARFGRPGIPLPVIYDGLFRGPTQLSARDVAAARAALRCGDLRDMLAAADDPLTPGRFLENLFDAPRLTTFRVNHHPVAAERAECR